MMDLFKAHSVRLIGAVVLVVMAAVAVDRALANDASSNCCRDFPESGHCLCTNNDCSFHGGEACCSYERQVGSIWECKIWCENAPCGQGPGGDSDDDPTDNDGDLPPQDDPDLDS